MVKRIDRSRELLALSTLSEKREKLLLLLRDGPRTLAEIRSNLKTTSSGVIPQIRKMEQANLVVQQGRNYALTEIGEVVAEAFSQFVETLKVIGESEEFWVRHNIAGIPAPFRKRLHELGNYKVTESKPTDIFKPHEEFMTLLQGAEVIKGISPIFHPGYPQAFLALGAKGVNISLIVSKEVFERIKEVYGIELQKGLKHENAHLMVCNEQIWVAFTVTNYFTSLGLFFKEGEYDTHHDLISFEQSAIKWGEELFNYYKERSTEIHRI